jgi:hypothetical protein
MATPQACEAAALAPIIAEIQASGITTPYAIAADLTRRGIPTARGHRFWLTSQVRSVLNRLDRLSLIAFGTLSSECLSATCVQALTPSSSPARLKFLNSSPYDAHRPFAVPSAARPSINVSGFFLADVHDARKLKMCQEPRVVLNRFVTSRKKDAKKGNPSRTGRNGWGPVTGPFRRGSVTEVPPQEFTTNVLQKI